jgi:beta-galactosidase
MDRRALLTLTGNPEPNYHVVRQWARSHEDKLPPPRRSAKIAVYYHFDSSWAYFIDEWRADVQVPERQVYPKYIVETVYRALYDMGHGCDVIFRPEDVARYEAVIVARQLVHVDDLEFALMEHVKRGGKLIATSDLFRRNEDNAWLEFVPEIYPKVFQWTGVDLLDDSNIQSFVTLRGHFGSGTSWLVHKETSLDGWQELLAEALGENRIVSSGPTLALDYKTEPSTIYDQRGGSPKVFASF